MTSPAKLLVVLWVALGTIACAAGTNAEAGEKSSDAGQRRTTDAGAKPKPKPIPGTGGAPAPRVDAGHPMMKDAGATDGGSADSGDTDASADAATDAGADASAAMGCWDDASNFDPTDAALDFSTDVVLSCAPTIDTSKAVGAMLTGWCGTAPTPVIQTQGGGGPSIVVVPMASFTLQAGQTLRLIGDKPVVLAVDGDATINGTINAGAAGATPGAGGNVSCAAANNGQVGSTPLNPYTTGSGGGAFGGSGGMGGRGWNPTDGGAGGTASGGANLIPLRGGCKGANGFKGSGTGGAGGGAVQVSVAGKLTLGSAARITAPGGGGMGGTGTTWAGGAGGGSGGGVLIEAGSTDEMPGSLVTANGGAGGGARYVADRPAGEDGHINDNTPSVGGATDNTTFGGPGGAGGTLSTPNGVQGGESTPATKYIGGGGGGGFGFIVQRDLDTGSC